MVAKAVEKFGRVGSFGKNEIWHQGATPRTLEGEKCNFENHNINRRV